MKLTNIIFESVLDMYEDVVGNKESFIEKSKQIHKDENGNPFYTYDNVEYVNTKTPVMITCPIHGDFPQTPNAHTQGKGCRDCGIIKNFKNRKDWIENDELLKNALEIAKNYNKVSHFKQDYPALYNKIIKRGLLSQLIKSFPENERKKDKWTYDELKDLMSKYETKLDFLRDHPGAYTAAYKSPYWNELTSHMRVLGNLKKRMIYAYEFPELKTVYVGLTGNEERRKIEHKTNVLSTLYKFMQNNPGIEPVYKKKSLGYIDSQEASKLETKVENEYRKKGWRTLNIVKTGGLGGRMPIYTEDFVREVASKYKTLADFWEKERKMVQTIVKYNKPLYNEVTANMEKNVRKPKYGLEDIMKIAIKYDDVNLFKKDNLKLYNAIKARKLLPQVTAHMSRKSQKYTLDQLKYIAKKYKTLGDFRNNDKLAYRASQRLGFFDEVTKHLKR